MLRFEYKNWYRCMKQYLNRRLLVAIGATAILVLAAVITFLLTRVDTSVTLGAYSVRLDSSDSGPGLLFIFSSPRASDATKAVYGATPDIRATEAGIEIAFTPELGEARAPEEEDCGPYALCNPSNYASEFISLKEYIPTGRNFEKTVTINVDGKASIYRVVGADGVLRLLDPNGKEIKAATETRYL